MIVEYKLRQLLKIESGHDYKHLGKGNVPVYGSGGIMTYVDTPCMIGESILLPRKGTLDNIMYVNGPFWTVDTMYWTKINSELVYPKYLYCYLSLLDLSKKDSGSTLPSMTTDAYYDVIIRITDNPDEQKEIGDTVFNIINKITLNNAICANLEAMMKLLYDYWFVQFDFPDENGKPYKSSGGKMEWNEELKREIPKGWEVKDAFDIGKLVTDSVFPVSEKKYYHYSIPAYDESKMPYYEDGKEIASNKYLVPENSVLVSKLNPQFKRIWPIRKVMDNSICSTEFLPIKARDGMFAFLYSVLYSDAFSVHLRQKASSSTGSRKRIDSETCLSFQFAYNEEIALEYSEKIKSAIEKEIHIFEENQQLGKIRDFLLPMLMNGQIKIEA